MIKKKNGKWVSRIDLGYDQSGKRIQKQKTFPTKWQAEEWEEAMSAEKGEWYALTLSELWDGYYMPFASQRAREATTARYRDNFERLVRPNLGHRRVRDIGSLEIQHLIDSLETYGAKRNAYTTLRQCLRRARAWGVVDTVATDGVMLPEHRRKPIEVMEGERIAEYLEAVKEYAPEILAGICVSFLGARRSEVCALDWSDVRDHRVHIHGSLVYVDGEAVESATKTEHSTRTLVVPETLWNIMEAKRETGKVVKVHPDNFSKMWLAAIEQAGLPRVTLKNLRHSVGTMLIDNGAALTDVQNLLGHDLPTTTAKFYLQRTEDSMVRAGEMLDSLLSI